jgi:hypothetical protein
MFEQVKDATTPAEMRAELHRLSYHDPLVNSVFSFADYSGLSAEDRYTMLAYHAMRDRNKAIGMTLETLKYDVPHPVATQNISGAALKAAKEA